MKDCVCVYECITLHTRINFTNVLIVSLCVYIPLILVCVFIHSVCSRIHDCIIIITTSHPL